MRHVRGWDTSHIEVVTLVPAPLLKGLIPMLVLRILAEETECYGYDIAQRIRAMSGAALSPSEGALYPALHRLETDGAISAQWRSGEGGPRRRWYRITERGETVLAAYEAEWAGLQRAIGKGIPEPHGV
jgi:DNA-binding PadR family transcriptional regulator